MTGGAIRGNNITSNHPDDGSAGGGGISIRDGSSFDMSGGKIEGNTINTESNRCSGASGGGVFCENSTFHLSGGLIRNNTGISSRSGTNWDLSMGGGVFIISISNTSTFVMEGGVISGNSITSSHTTAASTYSLGGFGGGVGLLNFDTSGNSTMTKTGGIIYGNEAAGSDADGYPLKNTALSSGNTEGGGHAVCLDGNASSTHYQRNSTSNEAHKMDSSKSGAAGGWE
jgi:hypothetical protein